MVDKNPNNEQDFHLASLIRETVESKLLSVSTQLDMNFAIYLKEKKFIDIQHTSFFEIMGYEKQFQHYLNANFTNIVSRFNGLDFERELPDDDDLSHPYDVVIKIDADSGYDIAGKFFFALCSFLEEFHPDIEFKLMSVKWC